MAVNKTNISEIVRTLYDFKSQDSNELSFHENEKIFVLNHGAGDGWWEGRKENGDVGLFPDNYVEVISTPFGQSEDFYYQEEDKDFEKFEKSNLLLPKQNGGGIPLQKNQSIKSESSFDNSLSEAQQKALRSLKSYNVFSWFVWSGAEQYLLFPTSSISTLYPSGVVMDNGCWESINRLKIAIFTVRDPQHKVEMKIKKYIDYAVVGNKTGKVVRRRWKEFQWLLKTIQKSCGWVALPLLTTREVIRRQYLLARWLNRLSRHPIIGRSQIFHDFVNFTENGQTWKEKMNEWDNNKDSGCKVLNTVVRPSEKIDQDKEIEIFKRITAFQDRALLSSNKLKDCAEQFCSTIETMTNNYETLGDGILNLANDGEEGVMTSCWRTNCAQCKKMSQNLAVTASGYANVGKITQSLFQEEFKKLADSMLDYNNLLQGMTTPIELQDNVISKLKQVELLHEQEKIDQEVVQSIKERADTITSVCEAELDWVHKERLNALQLLAKSLLTKQIAYHKEIVKKLEISLSTWDTVDLKRYSTAE